MKTKEIIARAKKVMLKSKQLLKERDEFLKQFNNKDIIKMKILEPKSCPFCGSGSNELELQQKTEDREGIPVNLICINCGATGPWNYVPSNSNEDVQLFFATQEWNRRKQ